MEKINKGYAIIYVDRDNELLSFIKDYDDKLEGAVEFLERLVSSEFYATPGSIQWNYYILLSGKGLNKNILAEFSLNDEYARKIITEDFDTYLEENFPDNNNDDISFTLVRGNNKTDSQTRSKEYEGFVQDSFMSFYSEMDALSLLDKLRAAMIKGTYPNIVYNTHLSIEISLIKKKFDFLGDRFKIV